MPYLLRIPVHREHSFRFNVNARSADAEHRFRSSWTPILAMVNTDSGDRERRFRAS